MKKLFLFSIILLVAACNASNTAQKSTPSMQDFKYPYKTKKVSLSNDITLAYVDEGKGDQTLLFIHGLGSYLPAWQKNMAALKSDFRCIAVDLPNYGKSSKGDYAFTMTFFAEVLKEFIDKKELKNVVLVGHSMGAQIAMHFTLKYPEKAKKLVLLAPAGFETFNEKDRAFFKMVMTPAAVKATPPEQIKKNFELNFYDMPDDARFMIDDRMYMRETAAEYDTYCNMIPKCVQGMLHEPVFEQLESIKSQTLIIYGANDALIPNKYLHPTLTTEEVGKSGAAKIANSQLHFIEKAGHFVQWEGANEVNNLLTTFLKP